MAIYINRYNKISGTSGNDRLVGTNDADEIGGGDGKDELIGAGGSDLLVGGAGADYLDGGEGIDTADYSASAAGVIVNLATGTGKGGDAEGDTFFAIENLTGSKFNDILTGNSAGNLLDGGAGDDTLFGNGGDDILFGRDGNDTLNGGIRNDLLVGGAGADALNGGDGIDTADYSHPTSFLDSFGVTINLDRGVGFGGQAEGDTLSSIENVIGTGSSDYIYGNGVANVLTGNSGDDTLIGAGGSDTLDGGSGSDTAAYTHSNAGVTIDLRDGTATGGDATGDTLTSIENLIGSSFDDTLRGNEGANRLAGNAGNDTLDGRGGDDTFTGLLSGTDTVTGGTGHDTFLFTIGADDFNLTVTDWNPLLYPDGNEPPKSDFISSSTFEFFLLKFAASSGVTTLAEAGGDISFTPSGHDLVVSIHTDAGTDGTITFKGINDLISGPNSASVWFEIAPIGAV